MAYCEAGDLLIGDITLAKKYGSGEKFVELAADEIDAEIGRIYKTPVVIDVQTHPEHRPDALLLKKINQLLASGRLILDQAAGGEDDNLHAYGRKNLSEATMLLGEIRKGNIVLSGAEKIPSTADDENTRVALINEDPYSLVEGYYNPRLGSPYPMRPYDEVPRNVR